ncbi:Patched-related protein 9 [Aphelenchoides besseyi]|nr:Patched-related protein 9 [Aphelenchoides besseyi]
MNSAALSTSVFLHRSPSGAQRKIRQRYGGEWPVQKSSSSNNNSTSSVNTTVVTEHVEPRVNEISSPTYKHRPGPLGYRNLIESSDYQSVLPDDFHAQVIENNDTYDESFTSTSLGSSFDYGRFSGYSSHSTMRLGVGNGSANSSTSSTSSRISPKPTPMPRHQEFAMNSSPSTQSVTSTASVAATLRQQHSSGSSNSISSNSTPTIHGTFIEKPVSNRPRDFGNVSDIGLPLTPQQPSNVLQSPVKPMIHVHPFPVPRANKPQAPPVPEKPKYLQTSRLKSFDLSDKLCPSSSFSEFDMNHAYELSADALNELENQRIESLASLYEKVGGRWEDLKNLHNEKKKNAELFGQTMEIVQHNRIPTAPFIRFVKRFEAVYEVQTRLVLNKQQLQKELKRTQDEEFLIPLMDTNEGNTRDVENIVDELDATFRRLDEQLCEILDSEQHERWVFFVRTSYSLIAEQTSIQFKVRYVTDQIKKLESFSWETRLVTRYPLAFVVVPLAVAFGIIAAACYDPKLNQSKQSLEMFLPDQMESLIHLHELMELFPARDALRDSYSLFGSKFAYVIFEDLSSNKNILKLKKLQQIAELHKVVQNVVTDGYLKYNDLCYRTVKDAACVQHPILYAFEDPQAMQILIQLLATYPTLKINNITVDNAVVFGGVRLANNTADAHGSRTIQSAQAIRLVYVLAPVQEADEWISRFIDAVSNMHFEEAKLFYTSSRSLPMEMERNGALLIPWMPWMVAILIIFCALICCEKDVVRSQPFIGLSAMFNAFIAVCAATSTLIYLEFTFLHMVLIMPFLIISIGVDNMFLILKSWRLAVKEHPQKLENAAQADSVFVYAVTEVSVSLFITSLTDGLSFAVGSMSDFIAVRVFCTYCALAVLYMFLFQITLLNGLIIFYCRREIVGRHCIFIYRLPSSAMKTNWFRWFGSQQKSSSSKKNDQRTDHWKKIANLMQNNVFRIFTLLLYIGYLGYSCTYLLKLPLGLDLKLLTPDGSYVAEELHAQERLFADYGAFCYCVIKTENLTLYRRDERRGLIHLYNLFTTKGALVSKGEFWIEDFEANVNGTDFASEKEFMRSVIKFLEKSDYSKYRSDIKFNARGHIFAIKMIMRIRQLGAENDPPRAAFMRQLMSTSKYKGFVYDTRLFECFDQEITLKNVIGNVLVAVLVMLFIALLLIPRPASALSIALCIVSINIGVVGFLSAVGTRLDIISMITIVMSIGFSVDYATHLTFHYLVQKVDRLEVALKVVAYPIFQAALSTVIGVAILGVVPSYMIRTFVFTVVFVVFIGLTHTLIFLPVLLAAVVPESEFIEPYEAERPHLNLRPSSIYAVETNHMRRMDCYL